MVVNHGDGIIKLDAGDTYSEERMPIQSIILTGTAAGSFVLVLGNAPVTLITGTADLTKQILVDRKVNKVTLTSGPTAAALYILLGK